MKHAPDPVVWAWATWAETALEGTCNPGDLPDVAQTWSARADSWTGSPRCAVVGG